MDGKPETQPGLEPLGLSALFWGFFQAGILGFGGVLPLARRMLVEQRKWLSEAAFNDLFSLCQFMPGANIVNLAFAFGARNRGLAGAAAAISGLFAAPVAVVLCLAALYARFGGIKIVQHGLNGLAAAAAGLVLGTGLKIARPVFASPRPVFVAVLTFALVALVRLSLPLAVAVLLPLSILLAWRAEEPELPAPRRAGGASEE